MEEDQNSQETVQEQVPQETSVAEERPAERVNFSSIPVRSGKPKSNVKIFLGIFILIIFVVGGFLIFKDSNKPEVAEETPIPEIAAPIASPTATPIPVDKSKVAVEILNGTGISGEAAYLRDALKPLGYSNFKLGNASTSNNVTTTVTFNKNLAQAAQDEITDKLNDLYKEVSVKTSATQVSDVVIITGLQKGATAKPSATPTVKPSASPSTSPSATPTPTPTSPAP